ncbi:phosphatidylinositol glycan anchor biosynthesis class G [Tachypleus tridentatus]|uniref:phosphatidylinositol glycan anchor biosynthesis class G n=1 Tax=Tachypleus tridentatus TaxID=6853 RepID=UPI003FD54CE1
MEMVKVRLLELILCVLLYVIGLGLFFRGFFPAKSLFREKLKHSYSVDTDNVLKFMVSPECEKSEIGSCPECSSFNFAGKNKTEPLINRLVFIVIDALRADFIPSIQNGIFSHNKPTMPYVEKALKNGVAFGFVSKAQAPTVTLPRIKAMMTGNVPGFIDVIINLDAKSLKEDNLVTQAYHNNKTLVFYGDDMWLKLFPEHFSRFEGTTSFFVSDYTEVDNNVTRHLKEEMKSYDWDILILHYLGLDHIGHLAGLESTLLLTKLQEMDGIIEFIAESLVTLDRESSLTSLVVVCGDHGMSPRGSHGGVSPGEVSTPLIILSSKGWSRDLVQIKHSVISEVSQIDLTPTLAILLGLPIPINSIGSIIPGIVEALGMRDDQQLNVLYSIAAHLMQVMKESSNDGLKASYLDLFKTALNAHKEWSTFWAKHFPEDSKFSDLAKKAKRNYVQLMSAVRNELISRATNYDMYALYVGIYITSQISFVIVLVTMSNSNTVYLYYLRNMKCETTLITSFVVIMIAMFTHMYVCSSEDCKSSLCHSSLNFITLTILIVVSFLSLFYLNLFCNWDKINWFRKFSKTKTLICLSFVLHFMSFTSSSFIEEEHQLCYYFATTIQLVACVSYLKHFSGENLCKNLKASCISAKRTENIHFYQQGSNCPLNWSPKVDYLGQTNILNSSFTSFKVTFSLLFQLIGNCKELYLSLASLVICRILRSWNSTGDKWSHLPDVGDWLRLPENETFLNLAIILSFLLILRILSSRKDTLSSVVFTCGMACVLLYHVENLSIQHKQITVSERSQVKAHLVYVQVLLLILCAILKGFHTFWSGVSSYEKLKNITCAWNRLILGWVLLSCLLHRSHNIPMFALLVCEEQITWMIFRGLTKNITVLTTVYFWMGMASFFFQGNSNSLSTIDVSSGYVGLTSYNPILVGTLMVCNTYSTFLLWFLKLNSRLFQLLDATGKFDKEQENIPLVETIIESSGLLLCVRFVTVSVYLGLLLIQRHHLFVWTVFSPKLLYETAHVMLFVCFLLTSSLSCYAV